VKELGRARRRIDSELSLPKVARRYEDLHMGMSGILTIGLGETKERNDLRQGDNAACEEQRYGGGE
jgi:hypothetical protein